MRLIIQMPALFVCVLYLNRWETQGGGNWRLCARLNIAKLNNQRAFPAENARKTAPIPDTLPCKINQLDSAGGR